MYKGMTGILIPVLVIAVIGGGFWGYQENQEKNSILIKAENQYQRAFHDLNFHIDSLHDELGKSLVSRSRRQLTPSLANVWRLSYTAHSDVGQLPLTLMPFSKTEEFLAKVGDFSYRIAIRDLNDEPLTEKEYKTLKTLYDNSKEIKSELHKVQTQVIDKKLRWMDVETALAMEDKQMDNTIIDGFKTIDKKVQEFPEMDWGPGITSLEKKNKARAKNIKGKLITAEEAKQKAASFLGIKKTDNIEIDKTGKGSDYEAYSVKVKKEESVYLDITKKGGHVIWMMKNREVKEKKISLNQALNKVQTYLKKHNLDSMIQTSIDEYDNTYIITFVYQQDGVYIYPDALSVKVALDNGEIIGYQATDYIFNHKQRTLAKPGIPLQVAKKKVNPTFKIESTEMAIIENQMGEEILTYEITGTMNNNTYRVFINAETGDEEEIQKLTQEDIVNG